MSNELKYTWEIVQGVLATQWCDDVNPESPIPDYPRPQFKRGTWLNLNGLWDYSILSKASSKPENYEGKILVPFAVESALSGVKRKLKPNQIIWYRRIFDIPDAWKEQDIILHFGAVDWDTKIWVNGEYVGEHRGGYVPFSFEVSRYIKFRGENEIIVSVWDPTNKGRQERGKQRLNPKLIFYTAVSGIWGTVWLEPVPRSRIDRIFLVPDIDNSKLNIKPIFNNFKGTDEIIVNIKSKGKLVTKAIFEDEGPFVIDIPNQRLWSLENPFLYDLFIELKRKNETIDKVESYFGMRKISIMNDKSGFPRLALNNTILFQYGVLDQGYWPDGLYTAPTDEALKYDIELALKFGFNMIRKHVKVEPSRWYYHCDKLGILVWQDMPNGGSFWAGAIGFLLGEKLSSKYGRYKKSVRKQYYSELKEMIDFLYNHPSVIVWVPFNEAWGQFETKQVTDFIRTLDNSRLIDSISGWVDKKTGDIRDIHKYVGPAIPPIETNRVAVLGEFGGLGLKINGHIWNSEKSWAYKEFNTNEELKSSYSEILTETSVLKYKGLSAAIYTQLVDVEREINGLITYDRKVPKIDFIKAQDFAKKLIKDDEKKD